MVVQSNVGTRIECNCWFLVRRYKLRKTWNFQAFPKNISAGFHNFWEIADLFMCLLFTKEKTPQYGVSLSESDSELFPDLVPYLQVLWLGLYGLQKNFDFTY